MLDQVEAFFSLKDRFQRFLKKRGQAANVESLAARFIRLFESHGVHRNQIPRFFGRGIDLKDVRSVADLSRCLRDDHIEAASSLFAVRRSWLERGEGRAHDSHLFYLQPLEFGSFLDELPAVASGRAMEVWAKLIVAGLWSRNEESVLVLEEPIGDLDDEVIYRRHYVDCGPLGYWKSRVSTAALAAQLLQRNVFLRGSKGEPRLVSDRFQNKDLLTNDDIDELLNTGRQLDPADWLFKPDALLDGVDPERDQFGTLAALQLWLDLDAKGLMHGGFNRTDTRTLFEAKLAKAAR